jgi:hypothetical protein
MSTADLTTVLNTLPRLDLTELLKVQDKVKASLSLSSGPRVAQTISVEPQEIDYLLDGIAATMKKRGLMSRDAHITRRQIPDNYDKDAHTVRKTLFASVGRLSAVEYASLGQVCADCLAKFLEERGVPISVKSLAQQIAKVPQAVDRFYPDYLKAGLLSFAWRK